MLNTENLVKFCEVTWKFACDHLTDTGALTPQILLIDADGGCDLVGIAECGVPPYYVVRELLHQQPSAAFIFVGESWHLNVPPEISDRGVAAVEAWRATLPDNLAELGPEVRGECLMMVALGVDFSLERIVNFRRVDDTVEFDEEDGRLQHRHNRFFDLRELLVRPTALKS